MAIIANGTLMVIQQMTWNNGTGFTTQPSDDLIIPPTPGLSVTNEAGSGIFGTTHEERGLTWVQVDLSGHMLPQYAPAVAYRLVEYLLGRIDSINE